MSNISLEKQLVRSPTWNILKEILENKLEENIISMSMAPDIETIYQARGRYHLITQLLRLEKQLKQ